MDIQSTTFFGFIIHDIAEDSKCLGVSVCSAAGLPISRMHFFFLSYSAVFLNVFLGERSGTTPKTH
jgi:hypothetical protein